MPGRMVRFPILAAMAAIIPTIAGEVPQKDPRRSRDETNTNRASVIVRLVSDGPETHLPGRVRLNLVQQGGGVHESRTVDPSVPEVFHVLPGNYVLRVELDGHRTVLKTISSQDFLGPILELSVPLTRRRRDPLPGKAGSQVVDISTLQVPARAMRMLEKAQAASDRNKPDKALSHLRKALGVYPDFYHAYNNMGVIHLRRGEMESAERAFVSALEIHPHDTRALTNLVLLLLTAERNAEALEHLKRLVELGASPSWTQAHLGETLCRLGRIASAISHLEKAFALDPRSTIANYRLGWIAYSRGNEAKALDHFRRFLENSESTPTAKVRSLVEKLEARKKR